MAEKVVGRLKNTHELTTLKHGTFGTATYIENSQRWSFLRSETQIAKPNDEDDLSKQSCDLMILTEPEIIAKTISLKPEAINKQSAGRSYDPDLITALPFVAFSGDTQQKLSTVNSWFSLGFALWSSADGVDSGNLVVPVSAYVTGNDKKQLHVTGHGRQIVEDYIVEGATSPVQVPRILAGASGSWSNDQTIEQVVFSQRNGKLSTGSFLAVRHTSGTSIFQPLLKKGTSDAPSSSIDLNILVTVPVSSTGGHLHSDVVFAPNDQHVFAIIDVQGNWSSWKLHGRRSRNARIIYQVTLLGSGKLFSWENQPRPADTKMYFDGWHAAHWISTENEVDHDLLVCNRREARVIKGDTGSSVGLDLQFDSNRTHTGILDVKLGPKPQMCLVLTMRKVLLYDFSQEDWKSGKRPALTCAWLHGRDANDGNLKMEILETTMGLKLALYSGQSSLMTIYNVWLSPNDTAVNLSSSLSIDLSIPKLSSTAISSITFALCETSSRVTQINAVCDLYQMIIQHDDLAIVTILAIVDSRGTKSTGRPTCALPLPPNRSLAHHSERYVDRSEDEADTAGWIIHSQYDSEPESQSNIRYHSVTNERQALLIKSYETLFESVDRSASHGDRHTKVDLVEALRRIEVRLEKPEINTGSCLLIDAAGRDWYIDDIDISAGAIHKFAAHCTGQKGDWYPIEAGASTSSLQMPKLYEDLFVVYISRLPPVIPSRARVTRERKLREISVELSMSTLMQLQRPLWVTQSQPSLGVSQTNSQILSDPILPPEEADNAVSRPTTSASQPECRNPRLSITPATKGFKSSTESLQDTLTRLASFTEIRQASPIMNSIDESSNKEIQFLLEHVPADLTSDPREYNWRAHEISASAQKNGHLGLESTTITRKREKVARAQKRAESILPKSGGAIPLISSAGEIEGTATLPIRSWTGVVDHSIDFEGSIRSQPVRDIIMSDGIIPPESFSQIEQITEQISATQPVRGAHAGRVDMGAKGRAKKKRRAGF